MKTTKKMVVMCLIGICFGQILYAQVSPKASVSNKHNLSLKNNVNLINRYPQASLIQGYWSDKSDNNAIFYIKGSRVFFFDHIGDVDNEKEYLTYWKMSGNKLSFCYKGGLVVTDAIVKLTKDSLVLYRKDIGFSRYVRLK